MNYFFERSNRRKLAWVPSVFNMGMAVLLCGFVSAFVFAFCISKPFDDQKRLMSWTAAFDLVPSGVPLETALRITKQSGEMSSKLKLIPNLGGNAVPYLLGMVETPDLNRMGRFDERVRWYINEFAQIVRGRPAIQPAILRKRGIIGLWALGPSASSAIPTLISLIKHRNAEVQEAAGAALVFLKATPSVTATLVELTNNKDENVRFTACSVLWELSPVVAKQFNVRQVPGMTLP